MYYYGIIFTGFVITAGVTLLYGCFAPWHKSDTGKTFFTLLCALSALLLNSVLRIAFEQATWTMFVGIAFFVLYCIAMAFIGWHVYQAQIARYFRRKKKVDS